MDVYGLDAEFDVGNSVSYAEARIAVLQNTVGVLSTVDPHFPFARGVVVPVQWHLSSDGVAQPGEWMTQVAADVFKSAPQPLRLEAPIVYALERDPSWVFSARTQHRGL